MLPVEKRIKTKQDMKEFLKADLQKLKVRKLSYLLQCEEQAILKKHQILLRKAEYYVNTNKRLMAAFYRFRLAKFQNKYAIHIPLNCCGKGLKIMHVGPILINGRASIGENCSLHINTAIVAGGTNNEVPTLCDGVIVGVGAVVLGGITVAKNVAIGANAVVNRDVLEEDIAVAGVPAKKISNNGRTAWNKKG